MTPEHPFEEPEMPDRGISINNVHEDRTCDRERLERIIARVLEEEEADLQYLGLILADHQTVLKLNRSYLGHDYTTDVLSFPLRDAEAGEPIVHGEIYVDLDTAAERAPEFETTYQREVDRYVVHGLLHLIGYDDASEEDRRKMRAREERYV